MPAITPLPGARVMPPVISPVSVSNTVELVIDTESDTIMTSEPSMPLLGTTARQWCGPGEVAQPMRHVVCTPAHVILPLAPLHSHPGSPSGAAVSVPASSAERVQ
jgi:hypothetical protein